MGLKPSKFNDVKLTGLDQSVKFFSGGCEEIVLGYSKLYGNCICIPEPNLCELQDIACDIYSFKLPYDVSTSTSFLKKDTILIIRKYQAESIEVLLELGHGRQLQNPNAEWFQIIKSIPHENNLCKSSLKSSTCSNISQIRNAPSERMSPQISDSGHIQSHTTQKVASSSPDMTCALRKFHSLSITDESGSPSSLSSSETVFFAKRMDANNLIDLSGATEDLTAPSQTYHFFDTSSLKSSKQSTSDTLLNSSVVCQANLSICPPNSASHEIKQSFVTPLLRRRRTKQSTTITRTPQTNEEQEQKEEEEEESPYPSADSIHSFSVALTPPHALDSSRLNTLTGEINKEMSTHRMIHNHLSSRKNKTPHNSISPVSCSKKCTLAVHSPYHYSRQSHTEFSQIGENHVSPRRTIHGHEDHDRRSIHHTRSGLRY